MFQFILTLAMGLSSLASGQSLAKPKSILNKVNAQTILESTSSQPLRGSENSEIDYNSNSNSFFRAKLEQFPDVPLNRAGGESGGGGEWLENLLDQATENMLETLKKKNPHNLDVTEMALLVRKTKIVLSKNVKEFILDEDGDGKPDPARDAVNYFPNQLLIKLYEPKWREYAEKRLDVANLLYHEFLPFFFGSDYRNKRARQLKIRNFQAPTFENLKDGDFVNGTDCLSRLKFDANRKRITHEKIDNYVTGMSCDSKGKFSIYQCLNSSAEHCVSDYLGQEFEIALIMFDPQTFRLGARDRNTLEWQGDDITGKRVAANFIRRPITDFISHQYYQDNVMTYSELCNAAFEKAAADNFKRCQAVGQKCEVVSSRVIHYPGYRVDQCKVEVQTKLFSVQNSK